MQRKKLGRQGEDVAACYLEKSGYTLLQRNYTCRLGEIDIVALDRDVLVFVEVRSRRSEDYGLAQESVTERKKLKLRQLAWQYLKAEGKTDRNCRFDVVAVLFNREGRVRRLEHIENAF
ncbi:MAG TPA: YraN family protein [Bacillota bacterium]|nr:YraN family protein [Peptococcaceae bacterium MAG4]HPU36044.1 YraN family protein [Bacillota bacterium]HPZ44270.1 YraN family protein [Bacillota bacterium]HQD76562.1 YraN family protein [Bacillota bacterium]HUM59570.1 YraN family protein [Bacillota bacterium]